MAKDMWTKGIGAFATMCVVGKCEAPLKWTYDYSIVLGSGFQLPLLIVT
jgi:hypothetical protein